MPVNWDLSVGDVLCNLNGSSDVVVIFGSANGGWDYTGILNHADAVDVYGIRDQKTSWFQDAGSSFSGLFHIEEYLSDYLFPKYPGKKILCGNSMGASAALYFGARYENVSIIAASPQFFQYQFLWDHSSRTHYEMIEKLPDRLRRRNAKDMEILVCDGEDEEGWNWRDRHAAKLAEELFHIEISWIFGAKHASWELFSMRKKIEARLGRPVFRAGSPKSDAAPDYATAD